MSDNIQQTGGYIRPNSNGYTPVPLDTGSVELSENVRLLGEQLASNLHDVWGKRRVSEGWAYGPVRNDEKKTNPCMVYYDELTDDQKEDDRKSAFEALKFITAKGYRIEERRKPSMEEVYRVAWSDLGRRDEDIRFDAAVFVGVFGAEMNSNDQRFTRALDSFFESLFDLFDQKKALSKNKKGSALLGSSRYERYAHTRFAVLSPLKTESERRAAKIAAGFGIETYRVVGDAAEAVKGDLIAPDGDVTGFICDNSLLALAMWNGLESDHPGYDADMTMTVERALKGSNERLMELDMPDNITVYHMLVPADSSDKGGKEHSLYGIRVLHPYPLENGKTWYFRDRKSRVKTTDEFNKNRFERNVSKITHFNSKVKQRRSEVMASSKVGDLMPGLHGNAITDRNLLRHLYTDSISYSAQKRRDRQTKHMIWMAIFGLIAFSLISDAPDMLFGIDTSALAPVLSVLTLLFLTVAMCIFFYQRRTGSHDEYVNFRLMAECLRVQTYWRASGITESVEKEFVAKSKLDFEWARYILRSWELENMIFTPEGREFSPEVIDQIAKIWHGKVDEINKSNGEYFYDKEQEVNQYGFTHQKAERSRKDARKDRIVNVISIVAAYGLTILVALLVLSRGAEGVTDYLILLASLVQILVAGYSLYSSTKDHERLANNNTWLCIEYQKAILAIRKVADKEKKREIFIKTGSEAVREVCGWALEFSRNEPGSPIS